MDQNKQLSSDDICIETEQENNKEMESQQTLNLQNNLKVNFFQLNKISEGSESTICIIGDDETKKLTKKQGQSNKIRGVTQKNLIAAPSLGWREITFSVPHSLNEGFDRKFYLYGDFYFDLSSESLDSDHHKFLTTNKYKPNMSVQQNLKYDCVYLNIGTQSINLGLPKYSEFLVNLLNSKQDQFWHNLADLLKEYSSKVDQIQHSYKKMQAYHAENPNFFFERTKLFERYCEEAIEQLEKENKIYLLAKRKLNYQTGNMEYYQYVLSKGLIFLLGMDVPNFVQMTMRSGRPNIFDSFSHFHFIENQLQYILYQKVHHTSQEINLIAIDGSLIPINMSFQITSFKDKFPEEYQIMDEHCLLNVLGIIEIDVDPARIQSLIYSREQKKTKIESDISLITQNQYYNDESHKFLLKYYLYKYSNQITYKQFLKKRNK